jgi:stress-induced morphogen
MRGKAITTAAAMLLLLSVCSATLCAREVPYPQEAPRFTIQVPETWKPVYRGDSLTVLPMPEDGFLIQVNQQPADAEDLLPELTKKIAQQMQVTELKVGDDSEAENQHDVDCTMMASVAKSGDVKIVITVAAFTLADDRHFTVQSVGPAELNQKHKGVLLGIIDSIKPTGEE